MPTVTRLEYAQSILEGKGCYGVHLTNDTVLDCNLSRSGASLINTARGSFNSLGTPNHNNAAIISTRTVAYVRTTERINALSAPIELLLPYAHNEFFIPPNSSSTTPNISDSNSSPHHLSSSPSTSPPPINDSGSQPIIDLSTLPSSPDPPHRTHTQMSQLIHSTPISLYDDDDSEDHPIESFTLTQDSVTMVSSRSSSELSMLCDQIVGESNGIGIRAIFHDNTLDIALPSLSAIPKNETPSERTERIKSDVFTHRELLGSCVKTHLIVQDDTIPVSSRVMGGGWCGLASLLFSTCPACERWRFITTKAHTQQHVVREITTYLQHRAEVACQLAVTTFDPATLQKFDEFLRTYITMGLDGQTNIPSNVWPTPFFLSLLTDTHVAFWIKEPLHSGFYLQFGDIYDGYSHTLEELFKVIPDLHTIPQIKLAGHHYQPVHSRAATRADVKKAFERLADRSRAVITGNPDLTYSQSNEQRS